MSENNTFNNLNFVFNKNNGVEESVIIDTSTVGLSIEYDKHTANPKTFRIRPSGINFTDNTNNNTTGLERLSLIQQAFQAVQLPPNATTLKINKTLLIDDGGGLNTGSIGFDPLAPANLEIVCSGDLELRPVGSIDCNGQTIDMTNGRIIKLDDIESPNNVDLNIICKGTSDLVIETGNVVRLTIADTGVTTFTTLPECSVVPINDNQLVNKLYTDQRITHSYFTDFNSADGGDFTWSSIGAGSSSIFNGTFDATLATVGLKRSGLLVLNSSATSGNNSYYQSANTSWNAKNIKSITFGLIPLGNGSLTTVGTDAGNINQAFGITLGVSIGDTQATSIIWRISSGSAGIPTWTLVENNVVKETLSGTNLTGGLTNKWCRASIVFTNNGSNFYGVFTNLTDNVSYTTATFSTTTPNTFCQIYLHTGTTNNTAKQIAFDYCLVENNCLDIGTSINVNSSR